MNFVIYMMMKKISKSWKITALVGVLILTMGFLLRVINLTHLPIFADEAIYIRWAQVMKAESTLRFLPLSDGKQPLFMWTVIPFLELISDPLVAGRLVSVFTGLGTILGIFLSTLILFKSKKAAITAALIYSLMPFGVFFDRLALVDSMLAMFGVWIFLLAIVAVKSKRLDVAMTTGYALGGALLTKSPALFFALFTPLTVVMAKWPKKKKDKVRHFVQLSFFWLAMIVIGFGMYNILRLGPNFHLLKSRSYDYVYPYRHILESPFNPFIPHLKGVLGYFWKLGPWSVLGLGVLGVMASTKKYRKEIFLVAFWAVTPILIVSEFSKVMTARYVLFSLPYFAILAGLGVTLKNDWFKKLFTVFLLVFVVQSLYVNRLFLTNVEAAPIPSGDRSGYLEEWTAGTGIKETADFIREEYQSNPDQKIVVGTEGYFGTLPDGLQIYLNNLPEVTVIGIGLGIDEVPESLVESNSFGNRTFLVINESRLSMKESERGNIIFIAGYPKATRPNGTRDSLLLFEISDYD